MILLINHKVDWELMHQQDQTQINKNYICENIKIVDQDYKVRDKFMFNNHAVYKYKTPYKGPFVINQCWANDTVTLKYGAKKLGIIYVKLIHIHLIQPLKILHQKLMIDDVILGKYQLHTSVFILKIGATYGYRISTGTLA